MKKDRLFFLFISTYIFSYIMLVLQYIEVDGEVFKLLNELKNTSQLSDSSLTMLIIFLTIILSLTIYLIYYCFINYFLKKGDEDKVYKSEHLSVSIIVTEFLCNVVALFLISILPITIIQLILPIFGLCVFYFILIEKYDKKLAYKAMILRSILYLTNFSVIIPNLL